MRGARLFLVVSSSVLVGLAFAACGGKVSLDPEGDAGVDAQPTTRPTTTSTPTTKPTSTVAPPSCPTYRPLRGTACSVGLSCFYPCTDAYSTSIRATCPSGVWITTDVETCPSKPPPAGDCETCQREQCGGEIADCRKSDAALAGCNSLIMCINACSSSECQNKCVSDSTSSEGKALVQCIVDKCSSCI